MNVRIAVDAMALILLPVVAVYALVALGPTVDLCLAPGPSCATHPGVPPLVVVVPAAVLWVLAAIDLVPSRRRG